MKINKLTLNSPLFPELLRHIPQPPEQLYYSGIPLEELLARPRVAIVGSRSVTPYGKQVTMMLARQLAEQGIVIISGLAIGVDALAHQAALDAGGLTLAVLPSPLERIAPATNQYLARRILDNGGGLITEYGAGEETYKLNFIERNRLVCGLADVLLITEAAVNSGSLHTARFALEQGKDVMAVPGNITSTVSVGANNLLKTSAAPATSYVDVMHMLGISAPHSSSPAVKGANEPEQLLLDLLFSGIADGNQLLERSGLTASMFNQSVTMLELSGKIRALGANHWGLH
ncbi:MAG: hypothetical protein JWO35_332 [Candidatus Saccharibacteria bacterium]|nr:hypothetical protein [Candidatus Saccharibacteria bacterium]